ncbi:type I secretion system permease/ATPase [Ahrensia sp. R2A130]|uniref:type I secretion system permease/ATPase n=1 Tax=Ahrensia sp. R2A130 TaxID=744979 RepID=UPI0001E09BF4|nr:type I secretion system permease/ATPase [Ahrensia sp. R2A130]EFL90019.1 ABC transporter [Ahrensia sp. R2A130]
MDNTDKLSPAEKPQIASDTDASAPAPSPSTATGLASDSGMDVMPAVTAWLAAHHQMPYARAAVLRNVPSDYATRGDDMLPRMLANVGLQASMVQRKLKDIPPAVLPCVVFKKDGNPLIVTAFANKGRDVLVHDLADGDFATEIPRRKLQRQLSGTAVFATRSPDIAASMTNTRYSALHRDQSHWLWGPIRRNRGAWGQILVAALGINILALALPIFVMNVYDRVIPNLAMTTLWTLALGVSIALLLDLLLKILRTTILERAGRRVDLKIASTLFQQALSVKMLKREGSAAALASQIRDFESVREFFSSSSFVAMIDVLFIGIFVTVLWLIVGPIAIVPLLAVPVVIILALVAQAPIGNSITQSQNLAAKKNLVLIETLLGMETVRSVNGEGVMLREWEDASAASTRINGKTRFWSNFAITSTMMVQQGVSVIIVLWGVYLVADGRITVGGLIAANILAGRVLAPLGNISQTLVRAQQAMKSLGSISRFMALDVEGDGDLKPELSVREGRVQFKDVSFTYPGAQKGALHNIDFTLEPGQTIGLLGRVGSGKTTLGKLFVNMAQPDSGLILVDGHEIQQYDPSVLREGIGYLPQDPEIFTGTIRENIVLGRPNAPESAIEEALYFAGMDHFISENPEGLAQFVGEKGNRLSGGQRQAIALARLLLCKPKVLFLDEPTNAMDTITETLVVERLKALQAKGVTMVISTHRNSIAAVVDRLCVLEGGKIIANGPREDVMADLRNNAQARAKSPVGAT